MSQADTGIETSSDNHANLMDGMYRYQRHVYDLTRKYYLFGRDRTIAHLNVPVGGSLLEVGCGTGRNMLLAYRSFPSAKLYGLDISQEMLISARSNFRGLKQIPDFRVADATAFSAADFDVAGFDRVMISYALSMHRSMPSRPAVSSTSSISASRKACLAGSRPFSRAG